MGMVNVSRRWFIGGAASFDAFGGCRFFEDATGASRGAPKLTFGVVSDIHIRYVSRPDAPDWDGYGSTDTFRRTLEWFRDQGVDAVLVAGDMADNGVVSQLEAVAQTWRTVFPDDRAPDGRHVERVFVYGNHDMGGLPYARRWLPDHGVADEAEMTKRIIYPDPKGVWERVFAEPYEPVFLKSVKGYSFVGAHWLAMGCRGKDEAFNGEIADFYARRGRELDPALPFFHVQHPHPKDTCYGPWAWGRDVGLSTKALSSRPNAIAFSGHSHYSLTDERTLWQGAFTSVGTSSLRYGAMTQEELAPIGYENTRGSGPDAWRCDAEKLLPKFDAQDCRQGMLWRVYDDCIVVTRHEFLSGFDVGPDWVLPLPAAESRPFAFAERAKKIGAPSFASGGALDVARKTVKNRGGKAPGGKGKDIAVREREAFVATAPSAVYDPVARLFAVEFVATGSDGTTRTKRTMAEGYNHGPGHKKAKARTACPFDAADFANCTSVRFTATPLNCFGRRGAPVVAELKVS